MRMIFKMVLSVACVVLLLGDAEAARKRRGPSILELAFGEDKPAAEAPVEAPAEAAVDEAMKVAETPAPVVVEKPVEVVHEVTNTVEVVKEVTVEKPVEVVRVVTNTVEVVKEVVVEKPVEVVREVTNTVEVVREVTNTVEKLVVDHAGEKALQGRNEELSSTNEMLTVVNADLEDTNAKLRTAMELQQAKLDRIQRVMGPKALKTGRPAKITSRNTFYDRKDGVICFDAHVHVDDENYQMWADRAYVFLEGTNEVRRIVALGNVALTNDAKRAYGDKASYYHKDGMVVLYGNPEKGIAAELRDESKIEDQTIRGTKIKFWVGENELRQAEVFGSEIQAPTSGGAGDFKSLMKR